MIFIQNNLFLILSINIPEIYEAIRACLDLFKDINFKDEKDTFPKKNYWINFNINF